MSETNAKKIEVIFTEEDFDVFTVPGLEKRMEALIAVVRPKLNELGRRLAPELSILTGSEMHAHVAKHARRTVHPPNDTWVAWAANKRGYKMLPHFQTGLFFTHVFIQFAIIYESPHKTIFADALKHRLECIKNAVPDSFRWSMDHMNPDAVPHSELTESSFHAMAEKLASVKKAEVMVGLHIRRGDPLLLDEQKLQRTILHTFETLMPLYRLAFPSGPQ